jgi:hypothetical protein
MSGASPVGTLLLSVDLEPDPAQPDGGLIDRLDQLRRRLIELTGSLAVPVAWAVADPVLSVATESILNAKAGHEIAVLGDRAWLGPGCGRVRLQRELARRFDGSRKAGISVTTLALRNLDQVRELDLLLDHGITALRGPAVPSLGDAHRLSSPPIRYGIWQAPPGWKIPSHSSWWMPAAWSICREVKRATLRESILHLHLDAAQLATSTEHDLQTVFRVLRFAAARREAGQLAITTISQVAANLLAERSTAPSRSILRPAA